MPEQHPLDLYSLVLELGRTEWIDEIRIFGSRRYLSNASYGSDIDLLIVTNRPVPIDKVRDLIDEPYIDAFLLDGQVAVGAMNDTRINIGKAGAVTDLDAVVLWSREEGWLTGEDYRTLDVISDKVPTKTRANRGAIIIFCALASEFAAVRDRLGTGTQKTHPRIPPYYRAHVKSGSGRERLVIVVQTGVAGVNAGVSATRVLDYFDEPAFAVLVGITAGLKDEKTTPSSPVLGDVLVPTATVDVESGKLTPKGKEPAGHTFPLSPYRQRAIASWSGLDAWANRWKRAVDGKKVPPKVIADCTLACTASVIAYNQHAQSLRQHHRKIAGIEMEAVGIATACLGRCDLLVMKAISDWADEEKGDSQHGYCAKVSADLAISLIEADII